MATDTHQWRMEGQGLESLQRAPLKYALLPVIKLRGMAQTLLSERSSRPACLHPDSVVGVCGRIALGDSIRGSYDFLHAGTSA